MYLLASLLNLVEAVLLCLYFARNFKGTGAFLAAMFTLAASVSFSFCVIGLENIFFYLEKNSPPELSSYITKKGFLQVQGFYLLHSCLFCAICFYIGNAQWIIVSVIKEIILWCFAYQRT